MADLEGVLLGLIKPIVQHDDRLEVRAMPTGDEDEILLHVYADDEDIARLIGRKGSMASALRQVMSVASHADNKKVSIKFEQI